MTGPAHSVETSYEPHRNLITGVVNRAGKVNGDRLAVNGGTEAGAPGTSVPAADSGPSTKHDGPSTISSYVYANDLLGRRETISQGGEAFGMLKLGANRVEVAYNDRSEVVGAKYQSGVEVRQSFGYDYDAIGNRRSAASEVGSRKSEVSYEANALNQYAAIDEQSSSNPQSAIRDPQFDTDGNLLEDARNTYTWNADNNLIRVESKDGSLRLDYLYDHQSRRTVRIETTNRGKDNESRRTTYYLYDDWNLLADVSAVTGDGSRVMGEEADAVCCYTWGRDLSGSLQGAGGVGGLLAISQGEAHRYPAYDANGNIGQLIDNAGAIVAAYTYDPFGNVTEMAGAEAAENPWRFSTKPVDEATGWLYYGFRYYIPTTGRWPSRDPIGENGGLNVYGFVENQSIGIIDELGLKCCPKDLRVESEGWVKSASGWFSKSYTYRHRVKIVLELNDGGKKEDCLIRQFLTGVVKKRGRISDSFRNSEDGTVPFWNGQRWSIGGDSSAKVPPPSWSGNTAIFYDAPGFVGVSSDSFPLYWGGFSIGDPLLPPGGNYGIGKPSVYGGSNYVPPVASEDDSGEYFMFNTVVEEKDGGRVAAVRWGILINIDRANGNGIFGFRIEGAD